MVGHIAVLDPGTRVPELDCFNRMSCRARVPLTYHLPAMHGLDSLHPAAEGLRAVVIVGSGASVNDPLPWQTALRGWLDPRVADGLPVLGLCYGHQLLAHLLGGEVGFLHLDQHKERGLRDVSLESDPLWGNACSGPMMVSHREVVTRLPPGAVLRGSTSLVEVEAFAHVRLPVWGVQAHPEATAAFAANNGIPFDAEPSVLEFGHGLVDAFLDRFSA